MRSYAGILSYYNKSLSTEIATKIGRLHCLTKSWERASVSFLKSGGFRVVSLIPQIRQKTLIIWGKNDEILNIETAYQFQQTLPNNELVIIDECGHVPHLEKPEYTADIIANFISR